MARPPPPRLLSSFLGDRLLLSSRPLILRSAAPGTCHLPRCHSVSAPVFQRVGPGQRFSLSWLSPLLAGSRRMAYQATRTLCNLVDILFNRR